MGSLGVCESVLDDQFLKSPQGRVFYYGLLMPMSEDASWQFATDLTEGNRGILEERYYELAESNRDIAEWLIYADQCKGMEAFHRVEIGARVGFLEALAKVVASSDFCHGAITRNQDALSKCDSSILLQIFSPGAAKKMVDDKRSGSTIINYGNNNQIAGRDMSQVYQNIAQNNDVEMARAIAEIGRIIEEKGGPETQEQFEAFSHELSQEKPKPGVLKAMWKSMVDTVPKIAKIAASVAPLAKLLGLV